MKHLLASALICGSFAAPLAAQDAQEDRDVGFIQGLIEDNLSGVGREVVIEGFEGALSSEARIGLMTISDDEGVWFRAEGLVLDWNRSALLRGRLELVDRVAEQRRRRAARSRARLGLGGALELGGVLGEPQPPVLAHRTQQAGVPDERREHAVRERATHGWHSGREGTGTYRLGSHCI